MLEYIAPKPLQFKADRHFEPLQETSPVYQELYSKYAEYKPYVIAGKMVPVISGGRLTVAKIYIVQCVKDDKQIFLSDNPNALNLFK